ncbi:MAG: DUF58 domain-containing protein [Bacteriovoracaceae bacterium]|nr:DUF58 domain-containing protein [Bacteriovoracaceae bacterium]
MAAQVLLPKFKISLAKAGWGMLLLNLFILTVAIIYNNNLCYLIAFFVAAFNGIGCGRSIYNLRYLTLRPWQMLSNFVGQNAVWEGELINQGRAAKYNLVLSFPGQKAVHILLLAAGAKEKIKLILPLTQRGSFTAPPITLESKFPLGIIQVAIVWPQQLKYDAYPRLAGDPSLNHAMLWPTEGEQSGQGRGGDDFAGHRTYRNGESLRHVDWFLWARRPTNLQVKIFEGGSKLQYILRWDDVRHLPDEEAKLSQMAQWMFSAIEKNVSFRAELPNCPNWDDELNAAMAPDAQYYLHALAVWPEMV